MHVGEKQNNRNKKHNANHIMQSEIAFIHSILDKNAKSDREALQTQSQSEYIDNENDEVIPSQYKSHT